MRKINNITGNEQGFASIVIALVLIIVLALLTVGFAQLARREQQSALDKQLAVQANYAAESGINDAYRDITTKDTSGCPYIYDGSFESDYFGRLCGGGGTNADSRNCMPPIAGGATSNHTIDLNTNVSYSCLLVDLAAPNIQYTNLDPLKSQHLSFSTTATTNSFTIGWGSSGNNTVFPARLTLGSEFLPHDQWNTKKWPAVLQVSITPLNQFGPIDLSRNGLITNSFTAYLYPVKKGRPGIGTYSTSPTGSGPVVAANCDAATNGTTYPCQATINGFNASIFVVNVLDYYDTSNIQIASHSIGTSTDNIRGGQVLIDVTGKAKNVLKRLQERLPVQPEAPLPAFVEGQNICERLQTAPVPVIPVTNPNGTTYSIGSPPSCAFPYPTTTSPGILLPQ